MIMCRAASKRSHPTPTNEPLSSSTVSESKGVKRDCLAHLGIPGTHLEQMLADFSTFCYNKPRAEVVVRGNVRRYVESDVDVTAFSTWADEHVVPKTSKPEHRRLCKEAPVKFLKKHERG
jgi:hypothetical protein